MMYLHYLDPHGPYDPAAEHYLRFAPQVSASPLRLYTDLRPRLPALVRDGVRPGEPRFEDLIRRYDAEIFDTDRAVEALFRGLEELDLLDGTLVVITADHGEEFLEHGFVEHAWTLYRESLHVPLILWAPLAFGPSRIDAPVSGIDIAPTLLHLMEVPYDGSDLDGTPLLRRSGDELRFVAPGRPFIGELLIEERNVLRTVIEGDWKYIAAQRWLRPEARPGAIEAEQRLRDAATRRAIPWGPIVREELYRLSDDPGETRDLSGDFPEKLQELRRLLELYRLRSASEAVGPARPRAPLPAEKERLRALGYL